MEKTPEVLMFVIALLMSFGFLASSVDNKNYPRIKIFISFVSFIAVIYLGIVIISASAEPICLGVILLIIIYGYLKGLMGNFPNERKSDAVSARNGKEADNHVGVWNKLGKGESIYYTRKENTLFSAKEMLLTISHIGDREYYIVETPDGNLGRDMNGFFTEGPLKYRNIAVETASQRQKEVECISLKGFGNDSKNQMAVAQLTQFGEYAKFILLMKCGNCQYESPIESEAGSFSRECYKCGTTNKCQRGNIIIYLGGRKVEI